MAFTALWPEFLKTGIYDLSIKRKGLLHTKTSPDIEIMDTVFVYACDTEDSCSVFVFVFFQD